MKPRQIAIYALMAICFSTNAYCRKPKQISIRVVDATDGQPIRWVHIGVSGVNPQPWYVLSIIGEHSPVSKSYFGEYLQTIDGWLTIPNTGKAKGKYCTISIRPAGYLPVHIDCSKCKRSPQSAITQSELKVEPVRDCPYLGRGRGDLPSYERLQFELAEYEIAISRCYCANSSDDCRRSKLLQDYAIYVSAVVCRIRANVEHSVALTEVESAELLDRARQFVRQQCDTQPSLNAAFSKDVEKYIILNSKQSKNQGDRDWLTTYKSIVFAPAAGACSDDENQ